MSGHKKAQLKLLHLLYAYAIYGMLLLKSSFATIKRFHICKNKFCHTKSLKLIELFDNNITFLINVDLILFKEHKQEAECAQNPNIPYKCNVMAKARLKSSDFKIP